MEILNKENILKYLKRIKYNEQNIPLPNIENLKKLHLLHVKNIPFENTLIHYSQTKKINIEPFNIFDKIVNKNHGGYCFELNGLFSLLLKSIGYEIYTGSCRISKSNTEFQGLCHMCIFVELDNETWFLDVGFGGNGIVYPMLLKENIVVPGVELEEFKFEYNILPQYIKNKKMWYLLHRNNKNSIWIPNYVFTNEEFIYEDYKVMNFNAYTNENLPFVNNIIITKVIEEDNKLGRLILLNNILKKRINGKNIIIEEFKSEKERIIKIYKWFNINIKQNQMKYIENSKIYLN